MLQHAFNHTAMRNGPLLGGLIEHHHEAAGIMTSMDMDTQGMALPRESEKPSLVGGAVHGFFMTTFQSR